MNKRILAAFTAIAVAASMLTFMSFADSRPTSIDSVPVKSGTFEESDLYTHRALGVANDFHLFAFGDIDLQAHCNGNFAAPEVNAPQASGTKSGSAGEKIEVGVGTDPDILTEVSLATDSLILGSDCKVDYLYFPSSVNLFDPDNHSITDSEKVKIAADGTISGTDPRIAVGENASPHKFDAKIGYVYPDYMDFEGKYLDFYKTMSKELSEVVKDNADAKVKIIKPTVTDQGFAGSISLQDGINVLNITADELNKFEHGFTIENVQGENYEIDTGDKKFTRVRYSGNQTLIINLDVGSNDDITLKPELHVKRYNGTEFLSEVNNEEANVYDGTIILWNVYNSKATDNNKMYTGKLTIEKSEFGSILAPCAYIYAGGGINGNVIANKIETHAESHRCDFLGKLPINGTTTTTTTPEETKAPEVTTTPKEPALEVTTTPKEPAQEVTTTPKEPTQEVTTTPKEPVQEVTTTPKEPVQEVTTTPKEPVQEVTTTPKEPAPEVTTTPEEPTPEVTTTEDVAPDDDDNNTTTTTTVPVASPESTTTTANDGVANDGDDNGKTTTPAVTTAHDEGVADGGDGNDRDTGTGSDGDENNRPPKTGDSAPAALAVALIGSAIVITALKKNKDK